MSVAAVPAASVDLQRTPRALSRRRAIRWFRWSILGPLIVLLAVVLMPVLLLQLYFSFTSGRCTSGVGPRPNMWGSIFSARC